MEWPRKRRPTIAAVVLGVCLLTPLTGCESSSEVDAVHVGPCDFDGQVEADIGVECANAIAIAEARLGWLHAPITAVRYRTSMCPPNARCRATLRREGTVVFTFAVGEPLMIFVHPGGPDGSGPLVAENPEPLPDWLLEELAAEAGRPAQPDPGSGG